MTRSTQVTNEFDLTFLLSENPSEMFDCMIGNMWAGGDAGGPKVGGRGVDLNW